MIDNYNPKDSLKGMLDSKDSFIIGLERDSKIFLLFDASDNTVCTANFESYLLNSSATVLSFRESKKVLPKELLRFKKHMIKKPKWTKIDWIRYVFSLVLPLFPSFKFCWEKYFSDNCESFVFEKDFYVALYNAKALRDDKKHWIFR